MSILDLTALELGKKIKAGEITSPEATEAVIKQIKAVEGQIHSYVTLDEEGAMKRAKEVQAQIEAGTLTGPLTGVPAAIKDNMCTKGMRTTCSSKILENFVPTYTAEAVLNLEKAGAVILGKTNMDEFAMGSTTETSAYGVTRNPWNTEHVPGGSSGGSCAAVAANECFYALGSDTGGSIRQPSSFCGVTGVKPTYGTVSRYGLIAYGSSLDQIGPVAKDVSDCAAILEAISSHDLKDSTSMARTDCDFTSALKDDVKGMKIGIPSSYFGEGLDEEVKAAILKAADILKEKAKGANIEFTGYKEWPEIKEIVGKARFSVVPSEWYENNPLSVIEAQCLGTPVLGANIGGIPELIKEGVNGMCFESRNIMDLKNKIEKMFILNVDYKQLAKSSQIRYSSEKHYNELLELYQQ